jgi:hypothetical protein
VSSSLVPVRTLPSKAKSLVKRRTLFGFAKVWGEVREDLSLSVNAPDEFVEEVVHEEDGWGRVQSWFSSVAGKPANPFTSGIKARFQGACKGMNPQARSLLAAGGLTSSVCALHNVDDLKRPDVQRREDTQLQKMEHGTL